MMKKKQFLNLRAQKSSHSLYVVVVVCMYQMTIKKFFSLVEITNDDAIFIAHLLQQIFQFVKSYKSQFLFWIILILSNQDGRNPTKTMFICRCRRHWKSIIKTCFVFERLKCLISEFHKKKKVFYSSSSMQLLIFWDFSFFFV